MADLYDEFQIGQDPQSNQQTGGDLFDEFSLDVPEPEGKGVLGHVRDIGLSAAKSVIGVPEAMVGLADIPTGGAVGKALENEGGTFGVRFTSADGPSPTADLSETPFSSSLGHGVPALDAELRERVFDHRAAVIQAENQILYLQDYARLCAAGAAP